MKVVFHTLCVSPHQFPLARGLVNKLGEKSYFYLYDEPLSKERIGLGWQPEAEEEWLLCTADNPNMCRQLMLEADVFLSGQRDLEIFEIRARQGRMSIYTSERWFKPIPFFHSKMCGRFCLPGIFRMISPRYFRMARRMRRLIRDSPAFYYFPMGVWAAWDMAIIMGWRSKLGREFFTRRWKPCDRIDEAGKFRMWGYFVETARKVDRIPNRQSPQLHVLWVGRMLEWKSVDTIIRAVMDLSDVSLDIYGDGVGKKRLKAMSEHHDNIHFHDAVPINRVRELMRENDVYVLSSNGEEGWGATLNEALEEQMTVLGTFEAGASATMLDRPSLYYFNDVNRLRTLLIGLRDKKQREGKLDKGNIAEWSVDNASEKLLSFISNPERSL